TPVERAQAVEYRAANAEAGVGGQLRIAFGIVLVQGVNQPHHAGLYQVLEQHVGGQALMDAPRHRAHLGQVLEQQALAFGRVQHGAGLIAKLVRYGAHRLSPVMTPSPSNAHSPWLESLPEPARSAAASLPRA